MIPRIGNGGASRSFHFGVDVAAPNGTAVYATATGTVSRNPLHDDVVVIHRADGVELEYWHLSPAVSSGQRVVAYQTIIGHILKPWAHVHFSERRGGTLRQSAAPGRHGAVCRPDVPGCSPAELRA